MKKLHLLFINLFSCLLLLSNNSFARDSSYLNSVIKYPVVQGSGLLTFWGFHIYDAKLFRGSSLTSPEFALNIQYQKSFTGSAIANTTAEEMINLGVNQTQANAWAQELKTFMPNVNSGQVLTAAYQPAEGTIFFYEGKRIAQIPGRSFAKAFFGIWLDVNTREPKLRSELLGSACPPPLISESC